MPLQAILLMGPTASGKTELAQALAESLPVDLLSADSMQVYRGMDIGTAKPTPAWRPRWGLLDLAEPGGAFSVGEWLRAAGEQMRRSWRAGRVPLLCGGTGLYFHALTEGLADTPAVDPAVRRALQAELEAGGLPPLAERLRGLDPALAGRLDMNNPRRVLRALEVAISTGEPLSAWQARTPPPLLDGARCAWLGLDPGVAELDARIAGRARAMFKAGWLEETAALRARFGDAALLGTGAIGYRECLAVLDGALSSEAAAEAVALQTRQYAKRQRTWFRRFASLKFVAASEAHLLLAKRMPGQ